MWLYLAKRNCASCTSRQYGRERGERPRKNVRCSSAANCGGLAGWQLHSEGAALPTIVLYTDRSVESLDQMFDDGQA